MGIEKTCPHCGRPVPAGAPLDLCPECMIKVGVGSHPPHTVATEVSLSQGKGSRFVPPDAADLAGSLPQLEILELIGQGGMGAVYKARQPQIDRLVALKILPPEAGADAAFAERFAREAKALARLNHPNIVTLHDFGQAGGFFYFVMEFMDGLNLRQMLGPKMLAPREAMAIVPQICEALQYAHDQGIVHRDIKPENILLDRHGQVKIADFGLAKLLNRAPAAASLTGTHQMMGTPHYMAPEQVQGSHDVDHRADIYSLGVVFYEMLTGQLPIGRFEPPSKKVQVDVRLDDVVLQALQSEPDRRYQHVSEIGSAVKSLDGPGAVSLPGESLQGRPSMESFYGNLLIMGATIPLVWFAMWWADSSWPLLGFSLPLLCLGVATAEDGTPPILAQAAVCFLSMIGTIAFAIWRTEEAWMLGMLLPAFMAWCIGVGIGDELKKKRLKDQMKQQKPMNT